MTSKNFEGCLDYISRFEDITVDTETTGLRPYNGDYLVGIAVSCHVGDSAYFPFRHTSPTSHLRYEENLTEENLNYLIAVLSVKSPQLFFNATFDLHMLMNEGMRRPARIEDAMVAAHLMQENEPSFALKVLADKYLDSHSSQSEQTLVALVKAKGWSLRGLNPKALIQYLQPEEVTEYAEMDVLLTRQLRDFYLPFLKEQGLYELWLRDNDYLQVLNRMERRGMLIDRELCKEYSASSLETALNHRFNIQEMVDRSDVNPNSSQQMQALLQVPTVDEKMRNLLIEDEDTDPILRALATEMSLFKVASKADNTYYEPYIRLMDSENVLHPHLNITGTVSARLSSNEPNLTAVPRDPKKYRVKDVFIARPGYVLLELDQSQAELRVACHYANEQRMTAVINSGEDVHDDTAHALGISRFRGKTMNFAVIYGVGVSGLQRQLNIVEDEARAFLTKYAETYPGFKRLYKKMSELVKQQGYIILFTGRRRRYYLWENGETIILKRKDKHGNVIGGPVGPHKAMNSLIQGTVAEIVRLAMIRIDHELLPWDIHQLLQVHDSVLPEVPENNWKWSLRQVQQIMEDFPGFNPRFMVDAKMGHSWGSMQHVCTNCFKLYGLDKPSEEEFKKHKKECMVKIPVVNTLERVAA